MIWLALVLAQEDPGPLVDKLGSDDVIEREKAAAALVKLGESALKALQKAAGDSNAEVASRAQDILRRIEINKR